MKIDPVAAPSHQLAASFSPGIYPYLGGSVPPDLLRSVVTACRGAVVSGKQGARLAAATDGVLVDPAAYGWQSGTDSEPLFDYDEWLRRQQEAGVPVILTDTPRIPNDDRSALRKALARWTSVNEPTLVVLPIEPWWLRNGLAALIEEVRAGGRPVALVLLHPYNGLDAAGAVAGLLTLIDEVDPVPVVMLRCDISAVGAVAHGAFAGFVGWLPNTRHGPLPMRRPDKTGRPDSDDSPSVLVPALHDYLKTSKLPALSRHRNPDVLHCGDEVCRGTSLLEIAKLCQDDLQAGRLLAGRHNMASTDQLARRIFAAEPRAAEPRAAEQRAAEQRAAEPRAAADPRDAWQETCRQGAEATAALIESGISLPRSRWLRQWLDTGSPLHHEQEVR